MRTRTLAGRGLAATLFALAGCQAVLGLGSETPLSDASVDTGADVQTTRVDSGHRDAASSTSRRSSSSQSGPSSSTTSTSSVSFSSSSTDSGIDAGVDSGLCAVGSRTCLSGVLQTCSAGGAWVPGWSCTTGMCSGATCLAPATTGVMSCAMGGPGLSNCGTGGSDNCCNSLEVAGGTFFRTYVNNGGSPSGESDPAGVSDFRLDEYDVTVGRFRQFAKAVVSSAYLPAVGSGLHAHLNGGMGLADTGSAGKFEAGWVTGYNAQVVATNAALACDASYATWTNSAGANETLPINCVTWPEAYAFCIWDGGFLPSEAEWEYAAAGGNQQREYPWGSSAPGTTTEYATYGCEYPNSSGTCTGFKNIAPVGSAPMGAGVWGQLDLAGEMYQWNLDWYAPYVDPSTDGAYVTQNAATTRVARGGDFFYGTSYLLPTYRNVNPPTKRANDFGFRCARVP